MFLHVCTVKYVEGYTLQITFNNGVSKEVNLQDELVGEIFEPLKAYEMFRRVTVNSETKTIEWPNGADFAPEFLDEIGHVITIPENKKQGNEETPIPYPALSPAFP